MYAILTNSGFVGLQLVTAMLPKVQELNNFAKVVAEHSSLETLPDEYFEGFSVILLTECSESQAVRINNICRKRNTECAFFWSDMYGEEGIFYSDFGPEFSYKEDKQPSNSSANGSAEAANKDSAAKVKSLNFPALETVLNRRWSKVVSRHFPLSKTFVRHRLLVQFRCVAADSTLVSLRSGVMVVSCCIHVLWSIAGSSTARSLRAAMRSCCGSCWQTCRHATDCPLSQQCSMTHSCSAWGGWRARPRCWRARC